MKHEIQEWSNSDADLRALPDERAAEWWGRISPSGEYEFRPPAWFIAMMHESFGGAAS